MCACVDEDRKSRKICFGWSKRSNKLNIKIKKKQIKKKNVKAEFFEVEFPMRDALDGEPEPQGKWQESLCESC